MKTFLKRCGFAALAAALLTLALVTCLDTGLGSEGYKPPPGKGAIQLNFNKNIQRSLLPTDITNVNAIPYFGFQLATVGGLGTAVPEFYRANTNKGDPIIVDPGEYILNVVGYLGGPAGAPTLPAAVAAVGTTTTPIVVGLGDEEIVNVTLAAYTPGTASHTGTFSWKITNGVTGGDAALNVATMTVSEIGAPGTKPIDVSFLGIGKADWEDEDDTVPTGYYYVDFVITPKGGSTVNFRHIAHIYRSMTTHFEYEFDDDKFIITSAKITPSGTWIYTPITPAVKPALQIGGGGKAEDSTVTLDIDTSGNGTSGLPADVLIEITNLAAFEAGSINWRYNGAVVNAGNTTYNVDTQNPPFDAVGIGQLFVEGTVGTGTAAKTYSTWIWIEVIDTP
ncbi:MAG: hypothetical protein LBH44_02785 [Treponema sp.]|jgi:hypothetical protein|nr:hypothetical protein [Treponema sp.]